jgi:oligopeptide transport system permease protein
MIRYTLRRVLTAIPLLLVASFVIYAAVYVLPGDPLKAIAGERRPDEATLRVLRARYDLDDPLLVRFAKFVGRAVRGDFGTNFSGREVSSILGERFPVTIKLALASFAFQAIVGVLAGAIAAIRRRSFLSTLIVLSTLGLIAVPSFVLAYAAQLVVGVELGWLPVAGVRDGWRSYVLPAMVLGSSSIAYIARLARSSLMESLEAQYIRTAIGKGMPRWRVIGVHAARNSMIPVVTLLGIELGSLLGGSIIVEGIFNLPGIGQALFDAVRLREGPTVAAVGTILVAVYIVINLAVDVLYAALDPRIRYTRGVRR